MGVRQMYTRKKNKSPDQKTKTIDLDCAPVLM